MRTRQRRKDFVTVEMNNRKKEFNSQYRVGHQIQSLSKKCRWLALAFGVGVGVAGHLILIAYLLISAFSHFITFTPGLSLSLYLYNSISSPHGLPVLRQRSDTEFLHTIPFSFLQFCSTHPSPNTTTTKVRSCRNNKTCHKRSNIYSIPRYHLSRL